MTKATCKYPEGPCSVCRRRICDHHDVPDDEPLIEYQGQRGRGRDRKFLGWAVKKCYDEGVRSGKVKKLNESKLPPELQEDF